MEENLSKTGKSSSGMLEDGATVVVIGGGPAGTSCAIRLMKESRKAGRSIEVILYEGKDFSVHHNQCVGVLSPPIESLLSEKLDIILPMELLKRQIYGYRLHTGGNNILLIGEDPGGPTFTLRRAKLDEFMLSRAAAAGVDIRRGRVTGVEFMDDSQGGGIRVYSESDHVRADFVVGAFGNDEAMIDIFERAGIGYGRPDRYLKAFVTKFHIQQGFIEKKLGNIIYAFVFPQEIPRIEFAAITPKGDHIIINIAGEKVRSIDMDRFLKLPEISKYLPDMQREELVYYVGRFPIGHCKGAYGKDYLLVGDSTGWLRPFKGKGITTAIFTGVEAADSIVHQGTTEKALGNYKRRCDAFLQDRFYGRGVRNFCRLASRLGVMNVILEFAKENPEAYQALFKSVSGHDTFRNILKASIRVKTLLRFGRFWIQHNRFFSVGLRYRKKLTVFLNRKATIMEEITVRRLRMQDIESVLRIDEKITGSKHEIYWEGVVANYIDRNPAAYLAAEINGDMVGFILGDVRGWEFNIPLSGWIEILGVDPNYQGKGIGRKLAETLLEYLRKNNIRSVHAMINWDDADLVDYFRSLGFSRGNFIHMEKAID